MRVHRARSHTRQAQIRSFARWSRSRTCAVACVCTHIVGCCLAHRAWPAAVPVPAPDRKASTHIPTGVRTRPPRTARTTCRHAHVDSPACNHQIASESLSRSCSPWSHCARRTRKQGGPIMFSSMHTVVVSWVTVQALGETTTRCAGTAKQTAYSLE